MRFSELVRQRYSVRFYKPDPVPDEDVQAILADACLAPTAANRQPFQLIVIATTGRETALKRIYGRDWFVQAPLVICACGLPNQSWIRADSRNYMDVDVAIVMDHLILSAAERGLGTCWVGAFSAEAAREVLGLPDDVEPIAFTPLGYPADQPGPKKRKSMADLVRYETW